MDLLAGHGLKKIQRIADRRDRALVSFPQRRMAHEPQIPIFRVVQVGKAAVHQRTHEVQGQGRALVAPQQQLRIGTACLGGELGAIDQVAPVGRQCHPVTRLVFG